MLIMKNMLVVVSRIDVVENAKHSMEWTVRQYYLHLDVLLGGYAVWNCVAIGQISVDDSKFMMNYCIVNQISPIFFTDLGLNVMGFGWYSLEPLYNEGLGYVDFLAGRGWSASAVHDWEHVMSNLKPPRCWCDDSTTSFISHLCNPQASAAEWKWNIATSWFLERMFWPYV